MKQEIKCSRIIDFIRILYTVLVQFVEKSGFVGLPYIAEFDKSKNIWRLQGQESDNTSETYYINNDCIPSSWKIIENSPEWEKNSKSPMIIIECGHKDNADFNAAKNIRNRVLVTVLQELLLKQLNYEKCSR